MSWESKTFDQCDAKDVFDWAKLRTDVFFLEQSINEEELDRWDCHPMTVHLWCREDGQMVGYARVVRKPEADSGDGGVTTSIGRLVVDDGFRGRGIAHELMRRCLAIIGDEDTIVHAQNYIQSLYHRHGFEAIGESFEEAGIAHTRMIRRAKGGQ